MLLSAYDGLTPRRRYGLLRSQLETDRSSYISHWRDLVDFLQPRRGRFFVTENNRGNRRSTRIIDSTASLALRTLASGMSSGITSPARPWFRLTTPDPDLSEHQAVKVWLTEVTDRMRTVFLRSNLYNVLPPSYADLGGFGTSVVSVLENDSATIRVKRYPIGSYYLATDELDDVRVFMRDFEMTVRQMASKFGVDQLSSAVKNLYDRGQLESWVPVTHVVAPNDRADPERIGGKFLPFHSCYYETGAPEDKVLLEEGFKEFPILATRWETEGEDVYGTNCPGMLALGDTTMLQTGERRSLQAVEKQVSPPMTGPTSMRQAKASIIAGDITYVDVREGQQGFRPAHEVRLSIQELEMKQQQVRARIQRAFYEDLFLMLAYQDPSQGRQPVTAAEIAARQDEKLQVLGPVLEQLNQDLLDPLIDRTFAIMLRRGQVPPPPQELQGQPLRVEYISIMAQAQKMVDTSGLERFSGFVSPIAEISPASLDKVNFDELIDSFGDALGINPSILVADEQVAAMRKSRAAQAAAQQQADQLSKLAPAAKQLSETNTQQPSALTDLMQAASSSGQGQPGNLPLPVGAPNGAP